MEVAMTKLGVVTYLTPDGPIVEQNITDLERCLQEAESDGPGNMVLNMEHVAIVDGRGLEFLLELSARLKETGGSLRLTNPNDDCRDILTLTRLDKELVVSDVEDGSGVLQS
jgi:anti-anti-sigma factor